jgi:hypothetical protein
VALFTLAFQRIAKAPEALRAPLLAPLLGKTAPSDAAIERAVTALFDKTKLTDGKLRQKLFETAKPKDLVAQRDPLLSLALALRPLDKAREEGDETHQGGLLRLRPAYVTALRAMKGGELAPDANGTLRVTYGTVRGYAPSDDAPVFRPFTTLPELVAKATGKEPFDAPPRLLAAAKERKFGPLLAAPLGELPVNFLADLDITGGNSGSATLNARGELVGLAFDGNIEAMASDWLFQPKVQRSIHVDLRYLLWVAREVDRAEGVLAELGAAP